MYGQKIFAQVRIFLHHSSVPFTPSPPTISEKEVQGKQRVSREWRSESGCGGVGFVCGGVVAVAAAVAAAAAAAVGGVGRRLQRRLWWRGGGDGGMRNSCG